MCIRDRGRVTSGGSSIAAFVFDRQEGAFMVWLILLIAAVVLAPVLVGIIGNIDYKRQITGKKKMGKLKDSEHVYQEEKKKMGIRDSRDTSPVMA